MESHDTAIHTRRQISKNSAILFEAVHAGDVALVKSLAPISNMSTRGEEGLTPLMVACAHGHPNCAEELLRRSDVNATDSRGRTALMFAAEAGNEACVAMLMPTSNAKIQAHDGSTALMAAALQGHEACVERLLPASDLGSVSRQGINAAGMAELGGNTVCAARIGAFAAAQAERRVVAEHASTAGLKASTTKSLAI